MKHNAVLIMRKQGKQFAPCELVVKAFKCRLDFWDICYKRNVDCFSILQPEEWSGEVDYISDSDSCGEIQDRLEIDLEVPFDLGYHVRKCLENGTSFICSSIDKRSLYKLVPVEISGKFTYQAQQVINALGMPFEMVLF